MSLSRFTVVAPFGAWSPSDRDHPEKRVSISPGDRHLFTDGAENTGIFVKFLKNGEWYEAERRDFARSTALLKEDREKGSGLSRAAEG